MSHGWLEILVLSMGMAACASMPPPHDRQASSEAAVRAAREVGAEQIPQAALHLKLAQEQADKAKALMRAGDNEEAAYLLLRAQSDAELALALAHENKTRIEAQQVIDRARAVGGGPSEAAKQPPPAVNPNPAQNPVP
jgi:hypothetical protein